MYPPSTCSHSTSASALLVHSSRTTQAPPPKPFPWTWQCHRCRQIYSIGVTRRCLEDGHVFCVGEKNQKRSERQRKLQGASQQEQQQQEQQLKQNKVCKSVFDYERWQGWGEWRRKLWRWLDWESEGWQRTKRGRKAGSSSQLAQDEAKDCWMQCDYPSQCRREKRLGVDAEMAPVDEEMEWSVEVNAAAAAEAEQGLFEDLMDLSEDNFSPVSPLSPE